MYVYKLINKYEFSDISDVFLLQYGKQNPNMFCFCIAYNNLKKELDKHKYSENTQCLLYVSPNNVFYKDSMEIGDVDYSLIGVNWNLLLNMKIESNIHCEKTILSYILWELTFFGYSEEEINTRLNEGLDGYFSTETLSSLFEDDYLQ